jgi:hypothetical protein
MADSISLRGILCVGEKTPSAATRHLPQGGDKTVVLSDLQYNRRDINPPFGELGVKMGELKGGERKEDNQNFLILFTDSSV